MMIEKGAETPKMMKDKPPLSFAAQKIWETYLSIKKGCERVDYISMDAFMRVTGETLGQHEVNIMMDIELERISE